MERIKETQLDYQPLAMMPFRLQSLSKSLPDEHSVIRDALDAQAETNHEAITQKLQEKGAHLNRESGETKISETAMYG